jgi:hypothetical protein
MSDVEQAPREQEVIVGTIAGIIQKGVDKWQVAVMPEGSQYAKNLWTKSPTTVGELSALIGQKRYFLCNASHWTRQDGGSVRSLWLDTYSIDPLGTAPVATAGPAATPSAGPQPHHEVMHFADKDRVISRLSCLSTAAKVLDAIASEQIADPGLEVIELAGRFELWTYRDIDPLPSAEGGRSSPAAPSEETPPDPGDDIPF